MPHPRLPAELLDHVIDYLQDSEDALGNCCLVSKSWIPRARKHLFAEVVFEFAEELGLWKDTFPNSSTSPAYYTRSLVICCPKAVTTADAEDGGWIPTFSRVVRLVVTQRWMSCDLEVSLIPFHGFSPLLKSLSVASHSIPFSRIFDLLFSFPLLEDLTVLNRDTPMLYLGKDSFDEEPIVVKPLPSPPLSGSLELSLPTGLKPVASRLLSFSSGPHFRKMDLTWEYEDDISWTTALVEKCCSTLESLAIMYYDESLPHSFGLSNVTKLKDLEFVCNESPKWITTILQTVTLNHTNLRQILVHVPALFNSNAEWLEFDRLLAKLWESHLVRLEVRYSVPVWIDNEGARKSMEKILPEVVAKGIVDLVESDIS